MGAIPIDSLMEERIPPPGPSRMEGRCCFRHAGPRRMRVRKSSSRIVSIDGRRQSFSKEEQAMSPTIFPEIVRCNLRPMRHALDEGETHELKPEQADELFFLC